MAYEKEVQLRTNLEIVELTSSVPTDVTSPDGLKYLVSVVSKHHDSVDILFANGNLVANKANDQLEFYTRIQFMYKQVNH